MLGSSCRKVFPCGQVETVFCRLYLPENNTSRHVVIALSENIKIVDRDGNLLDKPFCHDIPKQWRRLTERRYGRYKLTVFYKYWVVNSLQLR